MERMNLVRFITKYTRYEVHEALNKAWEMNEEYYFFCFHWVLILKAS